MLYTPGEAKMASPIFYDVASLQANWVAWDRLKLRHGERFDPMAETLSSTQWTPYPVELVFAFFANPANLPHLMPKWQQARIESTRLVAAPLRPVAEKTELRYQSPAAGVGSEMEISFRPLPGVPFRLGWLARITEFEWNSHFCDEQVTGPFASWKHRHEIAAEAGMDASGQLCAGTRISDRVEYVVPLGPLGAIANAVFVRRQMAATFAFRQAKLEEILPVAMRQAGQRT
jgi:ligand-binding SRPBCC domain-containing protein